MSKLATINEFDAEYARLVKAAEDNISGGHHTPELDALDMYCRWMTFKANEGSFLIN